MDSVVEKLFFLVFKPTIHTTVSSSVLSYRKCFFYIRSLSHSITHHVFSRVTSYEGTVEHLIEHKFTNYENVIFYSQPLAWHIICRSWGDCVEKWQNMVYIWCACSCWPPCAPLKLRPNGATQIYYYFFIIISSFMRILAELELSLRFWPHLTQNCEVFDMTQLLNAMKDISNTFKIF